ALSAREDIHAGAQEAIDPDRALGPHHLVAQVESAAKGPAHLELPDGAVGIFDQADGMVLRVDRFDLRVGPAHHLDGADVATDIVARDLDTVAREIEDGPAAGLVLVPEPVAVRAGMRLARPRP